MGDGYNFQQLKSEILALSKAQDWAVAKKEWKLVAVSEADEPERGHRRIRSMAYAKTKAFAVLRLAKRAGSHGLKLKISTMVDSRFMERRKTMACTYGFSAGF